MDRGFEINLRADLGGDGGSLFLTEAYSARPGVHESTESQVSPHHERKTVVWYTDYWYSKIQTHTLLTKPIMHIQVHTQY